MGNILPKLGLAKHLPKQSLGKCLIIHLGASPNGAVVTESDRDRESLRHLFKRIGFNLRIVTITTDEEEPEECVYANLAIEVFAEQKNHLEEVVADTLHREIRNFVNQENPFDVAMLMIFATNGVLLDGNLYAIGSHAQCFDGSINLIMVRDVMSAFNDAYAPTLRGKQKLIFLQVDHATTIPRRRNTQWDNRENPLYDASLPVSDLLMAFPVRPSLSGEPTFATTLAAVIRQIPKGAMAEILNLLREAGQHCPNVVTIHHWTRSLYFCHKEDADIEDDISQMVIKNLKLESIKK